MLHTIFFRFLSISVTMGILIGILLLLAPVFRKRYTEKWKYWIWLFIAIRLIVPITMPESKAAIVINVPYTEAAIPMVSDSEETTYVYRENSTIVQDTAETLETDDFVPVERLEGMVSEETVIEKEQADILNSVPDFLLKLNFPDIACLIWISGIVFFILYHVVSHMVFRKGMLQRAHSPKGEQIPEALRCISEELGVKKSVRIQICKYASSPMMIGLLQPILILPKETYSRDELDFILKHELYHCKRNDLWYKLILLAANAIHWFNPLVWLLYREANSVLERTCDDAVLKSASYEERKIYTRTILESMRERVEQKNNLSTYFYGGKRDLKNRFINILDRNNRRSGKWLLLLAVLCILLAGGIFACGYQENAESPMQEPVEEDIEPVDTSMQESPESFEQEASEDTGDDISEDKVKIGEFVTGEMLNEEVYQELVTEDFAYQATRSGIYRVTEAGKECIYNIKPGSDTVMQIYEGKLYFKTYTIYEEGFLDWSYDGIKWIDLETLENGIVEIDTGYRPLENIGISDGFVYVSYNDALEPYEEVFLLADVNKEIFNGKTLEELTEQEKQEYGLMLSRWFVDNPGKLLDVSNRTYTENLAFLDLNMDGEVERISLRPMEDGQTGYYTILDHHVLSLDDEAMVEAYSENLHNKIWAISLDGKEVLVVLYEDGPSGDPYTRLFRYEQGALVEAGAFGADIRECEITEDGVIQGVIRWDSIQTSFCTVSWKMNGQNRLELIPREAYDFAWQNEVELLESLTLHTELKGKDVFEMEPQTVKFLKITSDGEWILLEGAEGVQGWMQIDGFRIVELDKDSREVFEGLSFAG